MSYWSVAQTQVQRERFAQENLARAGFEVYLPRIKLIQNDRLRIVALFPNYLFVRIEQRWYDIEATAGIARLLRSGDHPSRIDDSVIAELLHRQKGDGFVRMPRCPHYLKIGQRLEIVSGSFRGHFALYQGMSGKDRERVLLDLLGQKVTVVLDTKALRVVSR